MNVKPAHSFNDIPEENPKIQTPYYSLEFRPDEAVALLFVKNTHQRYMLYLGGACNPPGMLDETGSFRLISVRSTEEATFVEIEEQSTLWVFKKHTYACRTDSIEFFYEIKGEGNIHRAHYFRGYYQGEERGMCSDIDEIFSTAPNFQDKRFFHPSESFRISAGDNIEMPVGGQAFASPCYCVGMHDRRDEKFLSVGLAARPGNYTWDSFDWNPPVSIPVTPLPADNALAGGFSVTYDGKLHVQEQWQSPRLVITFAENTADVLHKYLRHCYKYAYLSPQTSREPAPWWKEPIYCTWHDQAGWAASKVGNDLVKTGQVSFAACTQDMCERWINLLEKHSCKPGIVILDATWAKHLNTAEPDPEKWRNMREWIEKCHRRNIRVFVWALAWATEGLPIDECITHDGEAVAADITNPKFLLRFRENIRIWFSDASDCLNADGIKLDGQLGVPIGANLKNHSGVWGLELQRVYMKELYQEAKKYKSDVCISTFVLNPYLGDFSDMARLGDLYTHRPTCRETAEHRAALLNICMPHAVIDTDGQFRFCILDDYAKELYHQAKIGIPTIYAAEWAYRAHFFQKTRADKLTDEDYKIFADVFSEYRHFHFNKI